MQASQSKFHENCRNGEDNTRSAIAAVHDGMSERKASQVYCAPRSTLQSRMKGVRDIKPKLGRKPVFVDDDERKLVDFACNRAQMGIGFGKHQFLKYAGGG